MNHEVPGVDRQQRCTRAETHQSISAMKIESARMHPLAVISTALFITVVNAAPEPFVVIIYNPPHVLSL
jgi:hypothetical protein